jgi:methionyl-tRNA formyltransferase
MQKILLLLNHDIHAFKALNLLLPALQKRQIKIILSSKVGGNNSNLTALQSLKEAEQKSNGKLLNFDQIAKKLNCEIENYQKINDSESIQKIKEFAPDLIISVRYGQILKQEIIKIPKIGVINLHSGVLPNYRGVLATFWAILNGENEIGTTLHFIEDEGIDTGKIIKISKQKINKEISLFENIHSLYNQGCQAIIDFINGDIKKTHEDEISKISNYYSFPSQEDVKNFEKIMNLV